MARRQFPISSEQLELLLAFESCGSLQKLAAAMAKDPSVVSRNLQQLAEISPVIVKVKGRWHLSPFGQLVNKQTTAFLTTLDALVLEKNNKNEKKTGKLKSNRTALLVINAQIGLQNPTSRNRSNDDAEENISAYKRIDSVFYSIQACKLNQSSLQC